MDLHFPLQHQHQQSSLIRECGSSNIHRIAPPLQRTLLSFNNNHADGKISSCGQRLHLHDTQHKKIYLYTVIHTLIIQPSKNIYIYIYFKNLHKKGFKVRVHLLDRLGRHPLREKMMLQILVCNTWNAVFMS